jgi:hypothetical protein
MALMAANEESFTVKSTPAARVGLQGYSVREEGDQIWVQNAEGTWVINKADIVGREAWTGVVDERFSGKPETIYVEGDAEIFEVRSVRLKALRAYPLALGEKARADKKIQADMAMQSNFGDLETLAAVDAGAPAPPVTRSLLPDTTGWGCVYGKDD